MRRDGILNSYHWVEDEDAWLKDILHEIRPLILGTRAINTSFDSGVLGSKKMGLSQKDLGLGWSTMNNRAVSPVIDENNLNSFLYTDSYDEWYFFKDIPKSFDAVAFCNYLGLSLQRADEITFEGGCDLILALAKYKPVAIAGWNDAISYYLIQKVVNA